MSSSTEGPRPGSDSTDHARILGRIAVRDGFITESQLEEALKQQSSEQQHLGAILVRRGWVTASQLAGLLTKAKQPPSATLLTVVGRYQVTGYLGRGGMGHVLKGYDPTTKRVAALKVIPEERLEPMLLARFSHEAQAVAKLSHPNIVALYEADLDHLPPYLALECVEGVTLQQRVEAERMPVRAAVALLQKVADAVAHAHSHGVIHRDLKPANILIDSAGEPKVTDFGLAHLEQETTALTRTGTVLGTAHYMAPEQIRGEKVDQTADIWSLGVMLYFMVSGELPFDGKTVQQVYQKILLGDPAPLRRRGSIFSSDLEAVILKCLEKLSNRRYSGARDLADDLGRWLRGEPVRAKPPSVISRVGKRLKRGRALVTVAAAAGIFVTILGALIVFQLLRLRTFHQTRESAMKAFEAKDWSRAVAEAERALEMRRDEHLASICEQARHKIAAEVLERRRLGLLDAIKPYESAIREAQSALYLPDADIAARLADLQSKLREMEPIVDDPAYPQDADVWILLGTGWVLEGDGGRAEEFFLKAEAFAPEDRRLCLALARIYLERSMSGLLFEDTSAGEEERAQMWRSKALSYLERVRSPSRHTSIEADLVEVYKLLAAERNSDVVSRCAEGRKRFSGGTGAEEYWCLEALARNLNLDCLSKAVEKRPHYAWALFLRGLALHVFRRDSAAAVRDYTAAIRAGPWRRDAYGGRADARAATGDVEGAIADFAAAMRLDPKLSEALTSARPRSAEGYGRRGLVRMAAGDFEGAVSDFSQAIAADPEQGVHYLARAHARRQVGDSQGAFADYDALISADPRQPADIYYARGVMRHQKGDHAGAILDYEEALGIDPRMPDGFFGRAVARRDLNDREGAIADLGRTLLLAAPEWARRAEAEGLLKQLRGR
ncbi:MAG: protein kinase [Planctomycetes bacterium]|nr:protein kinase [Planctomycetota bacterium]